MNNGKETGYGYGWFLSNVQESSSIEHGGGINGFLTQSIYLPKEDLFVAVFSNCNCNPPSVIATKIAALAIGKPYEYKEIPSDNTVLQGYTGVYENEKGEQRFIAVAENQLYSQRSGAKKIKIKAHQKDNFFFEDFMTTIEFSRNQKGEVEKLTLKTRQTNEVWTKTNKPILTEAEKNKKLITVNSQITANTPLNIFSIF